MYDISELKVGDIMVSLDAPRRQLFYIHNIDIGNRKITTSGVSENTRYPYFNKCTVWMFDRKATDDEVHLFYELIGRHDLKFNLNTGVTR
jgi:hypothetical protein